MKVEATFLATIKRKFARSLLSRILFGEPLHTDEVAHQTLSKKVALAVFASDALSSVAYATQEILIVLIAAGTGALTLSPQISLAIAILLLILTLSYRQTIYAYPSGGGAYIVSKDNLGTMASLVAGASLLTDYILTVAVSVSSGVDQIVSAIPFLHHKQVPIALLIVAIMTVMNLRGVKESGRIFAVPTYAFVTMAFVTLVIGFLKWSSGTLGVVENVEIVHTIAEPLGIFLILRAFSSGCAAVTGVEAISNGIQAFREPKSHNAAATMTAMSLILGTVFVGITALAVKTGAMPSEHETVISQIGTVIYGKGLGYSLLMAATTIILVMAANTAFADFPRLSALIAGDGFLPRQLTYRSGRLVFGGGVILLAGVAAGLIVLFRAHTSALIPLYAIGVFMSFTLSQTGMVIHWIRNSKQAKPDPSWRIKLIINAVGACVSLVVMLVFAVTKFTHGAWVTIILIPALVWLFYRIRGHYYRVSNALGFEERLHPPNTHPMRTIILVDYIHRGTHRMIEFAKSLGHPWIAVHVNYDEEKSKKVLQKWNEQIQEHDKLILISSPYRLLIEPVRDFILSERDKLPSDGFVHVITGQVVIEDQLSRLLHSKNARGLLDELLFYERVVVTSVPFQL